MQVSRQRVDGGKVHAASYWTQESHQRTDTYCENLLLLGQDTVQRLHSFIGNCIARIILD
jgi:hypothetical protein